MSMETKKAMVSPCQRKRKKVVKPCQRKRKKKTVSGTFLKTYFSKNENLIENYIYCKSFDIIRPQEADLRLRKCFSHDFHIL